MSDDLGYDSPKPVDYADVDYELNLTVHTIFKEELVKNATPLTNGSRAGYENCIPLLIKDLPKIKVSKQMGGISSVYGVKFKELQLYGHVVPIQLKYEQNDRIYSLDDGTGSVQVTFRHTAEYLRRVQKIDRLGHELAVMKREGMPMLGVPNGNPRNKVCIEMVRNMETVLRKIKQQHTLPTQFFTLGAKVVVVALPYFAKDETRLWASEMIEDSGTSRSKEIFFKTELIRTYQNLYSKHSETD